MDRSPRDHVAASLRRNLLFGGMLVLLLLGGVGGWAATASIGGAVIASGAVVVQSNAKRVQHQEGGIVGEILVEEGDFVEAGDLLVRLDDTVVVANLAVVTKQIDELRAQEARLTAERDALDTITFPDELLRRRDAEPQVASGITGQQALFEARHASLEGRKSQLREQISQTEQQITGLEVQRDAKAESIALIDDQLADYEQLHEKGLLPKSQITALKRARADLSGARGGFISQIAQAREMIGERRIQIIQLDEQFREQVLTELQTVRSKIAQLQEQQIAARDRLRRVDIRAPQSGVVHQLAVHTVGGVIGAGQTLMFVVPGSDVLIAEARVRPIDVDQVHAGQGAIIRLSSFDQRTTPELKARVMTLSPDLSRDAVTGVSYYTARLVIEDGELEKLNGKRLVPGMPVEMFIETGERSVLSYLVKPLSDQLAHVFRES